MDIQYIKEKIRNVVLNVKNGYMFKATNLEGEIDGMLYVRRLYNRKPNPRAREIPTLDWCRQLPHPNGQNSLDQARESPICVKMKEDLKEFGYQYKEEVIIPIRDEAFGSWRNCLRAHGINENTIKGNKSYNDAWYKQFIVLDVVETKTGSILEVDGRTYHTPELDAARDDFVQWLLGEQTKRFVGYGGVGKKVGKRVKDKIDLKTYLEGKKKNPNLLQAIQEENIEAAIDFYYCEGDRHRFAIPVFLRICNALDSKRPGWEVEFSGRTLPITEKAFQIYCKDAKVKDSLTLRSDLEESIFKNLFNITLKVV